MSKLALFYILLATDTSMMHSFDSADRISKAQMLEDAGVENAMEVSAMDTMKLHKLLCDDLAKETNDWHDLHRGAGNTDNKNNIGRMGLRRI